MQKTYNLAILGDYNVGKTEYIRFIRTSVGGIGRSADVNGRVILERDIQISAKNDLTQTSFNFNIWDYDNIANPPYIEIDAFFMMFDVTRMETFEYVKSEIENMRRDQHVTTPIILIGNKTDLKSEIVVKDKDVVKSHVKSDHTAWTSVLQKENLSVPFEYLIHKFTGEWMDVTFESSQPLNLEFGDPKKVLYEISLMLDEIAQCNSLEEDEYKRAKKYTELFGLISKNKTAIHSEKFWTVLQLKMYELSFRDKIFSAASVSTFHKGLFEKDVRDDREENLILLKLWKNL